MTQDDNYTNVILEEMNSKLDAVLEITIANQSKIDKIDKIEADVAELKADMKTVKRVLTDTNKDLRLHDRRITKLEQA